MVVDTTAEFRDNALLRAIPPERLSDAGVRLEAVSFASGEIVFDENTTGQCCYLVRSGSVLISKMDGEGGQAQLGEIGPGEFFGELSLFDSAPRTARATALTPTLAGKLDRDSFELLREIAPVEVTAAVAAATIQRLKENHQRFLRDLAAADRLQQVGSEIGTITHNMRAPLATIRQAADLLLELVKGGRGDAPRLTQFLQIILRTSDEALSGMEEVLARIRGGVERQRDVASVDEIVRGVREQVFGLFSARGIDLETVIGCEGHLTCERRELVAALVNLIRNALEAIPADSVGRVRLEVRGDEDAVAFIVSDTGCGIPAEHRSHIFESDFTHGKEGGTGLGLSHVKSVIDRHGGVIELESEVGQGTTFLVRIPGGASRRR